MLSIPTNNAILQDEIHVDIVRCRILMYIGGH